MTHALASFWRRVRDPLAAVGVLALACAAYVHAVIYFETHQPPRYQAPVASPTAQKLAARISPGLVQVAREYEPTFVKNAGGLIARTGAHLAYPVVVREIPMGVEIGVDHLLSHLDTLRIGDVVEALVDHAAAKGEHADASLLLWRGGPPEQVPAAGATPPPPAPEGTAPLPPMGWVPPDRWEVFTENPAWEVYGHLDGQGRFLYSRSRLREGKGAP